MTADIVAIAADYGSSGLLLAYMVWDKLGQRRLDRERIEADLNVARALTNLASQINHVR